MIGQYLITFREAFEAALIVSIILVYLGRTGRERFERYIWMGTALAVALSLVMGALIWFLYSGLSDAAVKLFEGMAALIAVAVLTTMIIWMAVKGSSINEEIRNKVEGAASVGTVMGFVGLAFVVVFREGFETVLFLTPFSVTDAAGTAAGLVLGMISALVLSYLIFISGVNIELKKFFYFTSILLILLAAGLLGYGIHELIEYREVVGQEPGWLGTAAFDLGISGDSVFHHKGAVGSVFAVMFGYSVKMEWARVMAHAAYLVIFMPLTLLIYRNPEHVLLKKMKTVGGLFAGGRRERPVAQAQEKQIVPRHVRR